MVCLKYWYYMRYNDEQEEEVNENSKYNENTHLSYFLSLFLSGGRVSKGQMNAWTRVCMHVCMARWCIQMDKLMIQPQCTHAHTHPMDPLLLVSMVRQPLIHWLAFLGKHWFNDLYCFSHCKYSCKIFLSLKDFLGFDFLHFFVFVFIILFFMFEVSLFL